MVDRVSRLRWIAGIALVLTCAFESSARGDELAAGDARSRALEAGERWVPGLSLFGMGMIQKRNGSVESVERGEHSGSTRAVFAILGLSAELSTPELTWAPADPRLFVHADAALSFDTEEAVVNEGDPGEIKIQSVPGSAVVPLEGATGRGSATRIETQSPVVSAGLGLAFELAVWDRSVRIKPSVEWEWQQDRIRQLFGDAESNGPVPGACDPSCRTVNIDATLTQGFHSLGPGLEIEVESARIGATVLTLYASGRAYHLLGSRGFDLQGVGFWETDGVPDPTRAPSTVTSTYERDPWHFSIGVGLRFLWRPE